MDSLYLVTKPESVVVDVLKSVLQNHSLILVCPTMWMKRLFEALFFFRKDRTLILVSGTGDPIKDQFDVHEFKTQKNPIDTFVFITGRNRFEDRIVHEVLASQKVKQTRWDENDITGVLSTPNFSKIQNVLNAVRFWSI